MLLVLILRTHRAEFAGPISEPPQARTSSQPVYAPASPGLRNVYVLTQGESSDQETDQLARAGINSSGFGDSEGMYVSFQIPVQAADASRIGDVLLIRARSLKLPILGKLKYARYELHRGLEVRSFSGRTNSSFVGAWVLLAGGPLLFWAVLAGAFTAHSVIISARHHRSP